MIREIRPFVNRRISEFDIKVRLFWLVSFERKHSGVDIAL